jgi:hypothetical protein
LRYQGQLFSFWNDTVVHNEIGSEDTRHKLDYELPAILPKLRRAINKTIDPQFGAANPKHSIFRFWEARQPTPFNSQPQAAPYWAWGAGVELSSRRTRDLIPAAKQFQ